VDSSSAGYSFNLTAHPSKSVHVRGLPGAGLPCRPDAVAADLGAGDPDAHVQGTAGVTDQDSSCSPPALRDEARPVEGIALLLGVDRFMSEARAIVNLIGNAVATVVIAKSEGAFDEAQNALALQGRAVLAEEAADAHPLPVRPDITSA